MAGLPFYLNDTIEYFTRNDCLMIDGMKLTVSVIQVWSFDTFIYQF